MNMQLQLKSRVPVSLASFPLDQQFLLKDALVAMMDSNATATARATYYNTREEQEQAVMKIHNQLFLLERGVYGATLLLPGVNDYARQLGVANLLGSPRQKEEGIISAGQEMLLIQELVNRLSPARTLKLFGKLKSWRINNARTRKLILRTILNQKHISKWAITYRQKMVVALEHAWGKRMRSIIGQILRKDISLLNGKETAILRDHLDKYLTPGTEKDQVYEAIGFVLGKREGLKTPVFQAFSEAKQNLNAGKRLPYEVLEGIRSVYHPNRTSSEVLKLTKGQLSRSQQIGLQRKAKEADVEITFDPMRHDPVRLYVYAYEMGLSDDIRKALKLKAMQIAEKLPVGFGKVGILVDNSVSMQGNETQKMRPVSIALATRDMLIEASEATVVVYGNESDEQPSEQLITCAGHTALARSFIKLLHENLDIIFILSDGYENTPAGRLGEVVKITRSIGLQTPVIQINPVMSAEAGGVRKLSEDVPVMPLNRPETIGISMVRILLETDLEQGISLLFGNTIAQLEHSHHVKQAIQ